MMAEGIVIPQAPGPERGIVERRGYSRGLVNTPAVLSTQDFVDFSRLRLLHLYGFTLKGEFLCLPERLKWLRLERCNLSISVLQRIPKWLFGVSNLNPISVLEFIDVHDEDRILMLLSSSSRKAFDALKVLHVESSEMTRTPDFSKMKCLRKLTLRYCYNLTKVDGSISSLKSLVYLDRRDCFELQRLPDSICMLMSLETLILRNWSSRSCLPEKLGDLKSLRKLLANNTAIRAIPHSIGDLSNLRTLSLLGNYHLKKLPDSMRMLDSLEELYAYHSDILFGKIGIYNLLDFSSKLCIEYPECFGWLAVIPNSACEKVIELKIRNHGVQELPPNLGRLTNLEALSIDCDNLRSLPECLGQFQKLKSFELKSDSLEALPASAGRTLENLRSLKLECPTLKHVVDLDLSLTQTVSYSSLFFLSNLTQLQELRLLFCENLHSLPPLPSSLQVFDARGCNNLRSIWNVSNLKSLRGLILGGCRLLRDFCGLETIAHNLKMLELPGPWGGLSGFSQLSPAFMTRVFKVRCNSSKPC